MFPQTKRAKMIESSASMEASMDGSNVPSTSSSSQQQQHVISKVDGCIVSGVPASVTVSLHPLVIMNISDHYTRIKAQEGVTPHGNCFIQV